VKKAAAELKGDTSPEELLGDLYKFYGYYHEAFTAALGGLVGSYAIEVNGQWKPAYGLKAFSPIAAGFGYSHSDDFGNARSFGFQRKHLGHDMMGSLGTPIVAVEGGVVEALGWNRYGGWRLGIRSTDGKRSYYYAHLRKDRPYAEGIEIGSVDDVDTKDFTKNKKIFIGYYGAIISRYKEISPDAKFFFVTFPKDESRTSNPNFKIFYNELYKLTEVFSNSYVIDIYKYGPVYDEKFKKQFYLHGHLNPSGYILTAELIDSYIDYIVRHNYEDFKNVGFINSGIQYKF
jgi:hypothetical protein